MVRGSFISAFVVWVNLLGSTSLEALDACASLQSNLSFGPGQLFDSRTLGAVAEFGSEALAKPRDTLRLIYVVQSGANATGALIIKARHQLPENANAANSEGFPTGDIIQLSRHEYVSPCTGHFVKNWSGKLKLEEYVDQHFYGINYAWKKDFHADSSYRTVPLAFGFTHGVCKHTYDPELRASFLYVDNPVLATEAQSIGRRAAIGLSQSGFIREALADTAEFYKSKLQTTIVPYNRSGITPRNCVAFNVEIPREAGSTKLEIIDSELGTHQNWQIQWHDSKQN